jgi:hypothetical protein
MLRRLVASVAIVCVATSVAAAAPRLLADLTGKWTMTVSSPNGELPSQLVLTQKGDSLTGTNESQIGTAQIRGVVKGDSLFFGFQLDMGGQALVINAAGAIKDKDNLTGVLDVSGMGQMPFIAARQPN